MDILNDKKLTKDWNRLIGDIDEQLFDSNAARPVELFEKYVRVVNLGTSSYCNRKCFYCPVKLTDNDSNEHMADDVFNVILSDLKKINYKYKINLNAYNEPLADDSIYEFIYRLKDVAPMSNIVCNSNGDYVTLDVLKKLQEAGLSALHITLHTPKDVELYDDMERMDCLEKFYKRLGISMQIEEHLKNRFIKTQFQVSNLTVRVWTQNFNVLGVSRGGTVKHLVKTEKRTWPCARPFREIVINHDGHCYPCCNIFSPLDEGRKFSVGTVANSGSIFNLYVSSKLVGFRHGLFGYGEKHSPCDTCIEPFLLT